MMMFLSLTTMQLYTHSPGSSYDPYLGYHWRGTGKATGHNWFLSSGWQECTAQLYSLAGEVTRKLNGK